MPKMMMGQIEHARKRVKELQNQKYGPAPEQPKLKTGSDLVNAVQEGKLRVSGSQLKRGFEIYVSRDSIAVVQEINHGYSRNWEKSLKLANSPAESVEDALASIIFAGENAAEVDRYQQEKELYETRKQAIDLKATEVEDAIVLGDQQRALDALNDFSSFEV